MLPPTPFEVAGRIAGDVASRIEEDFADLGPALAADLQAGGHWHPLMEAERLATAAVRDRWGALEDACERALQEVHETYVVQASCVREATEDLRGRGVESWIAAAVIHERAFELGWHVLDDLDLLTDVAEGHGPPLDGPDPTEGR
jgi:hypothetical protein